MTEQKRHRDQTPVGSFIIMSLSRSPLTDLAIGNRSMTNMRMSGSRCQRRLATATQPAPLHGLNGVLTNVFLPTANVTL